LTLRSVTVFNLKRAMTAPRDTGDVLNEWLYQFAWEETEEPADKTEPTSGAWLLLKNAGGVGDELEQRMQAAGFDVRGFSDSAAIDAFTQSGDADSIAGVVHLWAMDACEADPDEGLIASLGAIQLLSKAGGAGKHWFITKGAQAVEGDELTSPWQTRFWGLARTLQVEHPDQLGGCIDLDPAGADELDLLIAEIRGPGADSEVAFRGGKRKVARLVRPETAAADTAAAAPTLDADASYLVTGGVGALGLQVAQYLATCGAKHLVLTGRSGISTDDQRVVLQALEDAGVTVDVVAADIGEEKDVARVLAMAPRLRGIVHAAGVLDDGMLMQQTPERFRKVASAKVDGAWRLHKQTLDLPLDFFVMFSSVASVMGSPGQSNYASANAFMDGLAHYRRQQGLAATTINWGPWADVGMAASDVVLQRLMKDGWQPMNASQGCDFISHLLTARDLPQAAVIPVDWAQFVQRIPGASDWSTLALLIPAGGAGALTPSSADAAADRVKAAAPKERVDLISSYLLERIAQTLRVPAADLDEFAELSALGVDSLTAVELRIWVQGDLDVDLAVEQLFTTPSIRELAMSIDQMLTGATPAETTVDAGAEPAQPNWIVRPQPRPDARMRLFCFPFAGGGASAFKDWTGTAPEDIEICTIQLPGREERIGEPLLTDMQTVVEALAPVISTLADRPFAFFGHSMGAIVAYEAAKAMRKIGAAEPAHLFLSARAAPHLEREGEPLRALPNKELMDRLHETYGAVPETIRRSPELQEVFLPILRADVALLETHADTASEPLACPITVFGGAGDPAISPAMLAGWRERTSARFIQYELPGDHFFINDERAAVMAVIAERLLADP
ncbi:MAG: SDR family NAD(P)-dependent oxidoreductase, partial [Pseudomonadota bacterium]